MVVDGLPIPDLLEQLLNDGKWPRTSAEANQQNLRSLIPEDRIRRLRSIYLYPPPFSTVARIVAGQGRDFYSKYGAIHELIPKSAIEIGDFGLGSDSPILLDYRKNVYDPAVLSLEWPGDGGQNHWVIIAPTFASFVEILGLQENLN